MLSITPNQPMGNDHIEEVTVGILVNRSARLVFCPPQPHSPLTTIIVGSVILLPYFLSPNRTELIESNQI